MELKTEEELVTKKSGQDGIQENPSRTTETEGKKRELVSKEEEDDRGSINSKTEQLKEDLRETTDEPDKAQKRTDSINSRAAKSVGI